jgi:hypothetical protein
MAEKKALITPIALLSYPHLHQPQPGQNGKKPKYSAALVFTPDVLAIPAEKARFDALLVAANAAIDARWPGQREKLVQNPNFKKGFRTDAKEGYPTGSIFINVRTEQQPQIVYAYAGPDGKPAKMPVEKIREEMYPGARVRASVVAFAFDQEGNKGVSFALNNLQKIGEGERLDNRVAAENEFEADLSAAPADLASLIG